MLLLLSSVFEAFWVVDKKAAVPGCPYIDRRPGTSEASKLSNAQNSCQPSSVGLLAVVGYAAVAALVTASYPAWDSLACNDCCSCLNPLWLL
jgi:hypothetical protein